MRTDSVFRPIHRTAINESETMEQLDWSKREQIEAKHDENVHSFFRGMFIGVLGVIAIATWALALGDWDKDNFTIRGLLMRVALMDVALLTSLVSLYTGVSKEKSLDQILYDLAYSICYALGGFLFMKKRKADS